MIKKEKSFDFLEPLYSTQSFEFENARGASYFTEDGKEYIDMDELSVVLGQRNDDFENAIVNALRQITAPKDESGAKRRELYRYLDKTTDGAFQSAFLTTSGSEAVEAAIRLAKKYTGKSEIISFWNSIHGRTYVSGSISGVPKRKVGGGPIAPGTIFFPYPDCLNCPVGKNRKECQTECFMLAKRIYEEASAKDAAAIIVEPYQGHRIVFPPKGFLKKVQDWAREEGILFVVDEIKSGMGRTGALYRYEEEDIKPDILLLGKPLGNGLHISAMLTNKMVERPELEIFSGGSGGEIVSCAAACEVFRQLENGLLAHIQKVGRVLQDGLCKIAKSPLIADCRGAGLVGAVVFKSEELCALVSAEIEEAGFILHRERDMIYINPPYVITEEQIKGFIGSLNHCLDRRQNLDNNSII